MAIIEYYDTASLENVGDETQSNYERFDAVREELLLTLGKHGVVAPDNDIGKPDFYLVDDWYNEHLYQHIEVYNPDLFTSALLGDLMAVLAATNGWGVCVTNLRFSFMIIFAHRISVTGPGLRECRNLQELATQASRMFWGVKGGDRLVSDSFNVEELGKSPRCGCYSCKFIFSFNDIVKWMDDGNTALCPSCGASKVVGTKKDDPLSARDLDELNLWANDPPSRNAT
jgi:hypothetical protein